MSSRMMISCDRCGGDCTVRVWELRGPSKVFTEMPSHAGTTEVDLCDRCADSLHEWWVDR